MLLPRAFTCKNNMKVWQRKVKRQLSVGSSKVGGLSCKNALSKAKRIYSSPGIFRHPLLKVMQLQGYFKSNAGSSANRPTWGIKGYRSRPKVALRSYIKSVLAPSYKYGVVASLIKRLLYMDLLCFLLCLYSIWIHYFNFLAFKGTSRAWFWPSTAQFKANQGPLQ